MSDIIAKYETALVDAIENGNVSNKVDRAAVYERLLTNFHNRFSDRSDFMEILGDLHLAVRRVEAQFDQQELPIPMSASSVSASDSVEGVRRVESIEQRPVRRLMPWLLASALFIGLAVLGYSMIASTDSDADNTQAANSSTLINLSAENWSSMVSDQPTEIGSISSNAKVSVAGNAVRIEGPAVLYVGDIKPIDVTESYRLSTKMRGVLGRATSPTWIGIAAYDAEKKPLFRGNFRYTIPAQRFAGNGEWQELEGTISLTGTGPNQFPKGTAYARIGLFLNFKAPEAVVEIEKLTLELADEK